MWSILFANLEKVQDAVRMFRWAICAIGVGIILIGLVMYFYQPKDESKQSTPAARKTALISFGLIGVGTIVYAWLWFGR